MKLYLLALAGLASLASAQNSTDQIEVVVTRSQQLKPEEAAITITMSAPFNTNLEAILQSVSAVGLKEADLTSAFPAFGPPFPPSVGPTVSRMNYNFLLRTGVGGIASAFQRLEQLRRKLLAGETGIEISGFNLPGIGGSDKAREAAKA